MGIFTVGKAVIPIRMKIDMLSFRKITEAGFFWVSLPHLGITCVFFLPDIGY